MLARDIMTSDVRTVSPDDEVGDVLTRLGRVHFSGFPVVENDQVVGIITEKDLVGLFQPDDRTFWIPIGFPPFVESVTYGIEAPWGDLDLGVDLVRNASRPIRELMSTAVITVRPDDPLDVVIDILGDESRNINRLPVVDEDELLVGIITRHDVLRALRDEAYS